MSDMTDYAFNVGALLERTKDAEGRAVVEIVNWRLVEKLKRSSPADVFVQFITTSRLYSFKTAEKAADMMKSFEHFCVFGHPGCYIIYEEEK